MKKFSIFILIILLLLLQGCGKKENDQSFNFAYITDTTGAESADSKSVKEAFDEINEYYEFHYKLFEPQTYDECTNMVQSAFSSEYDLIIGSSYLVNSKIIDESRSNSEKPAAVIGTADEALATMSIEFKMEEASFLAGVLAASMSKTNVIGYIGGLSGELTNYEVGYYAGAKTINPDIMIISDYADSYNNVTKGYNLAIKQINSNADIIFSNCGASSLGVSKAINEKNIYLINSDLYQFQDDKHNLGITTKNIKKATLYVVDSFINSDFKAGINRFGIAYDMVDFQTTDIVPESIKTALLLYRNQIRQYTIEIPDNWEKYKTFDYSSYINQ